MENKHITSTEALRQDLKKNMLAMGERVFYRRYLTDENYRSLVNSVLSTQEFSTIISMTARSEGQETTTKAKWWDTVKDVVGGIWGAIVGTQPTQNQQPIIISGGGGMDTTTILIIVAVLAAMFLIFKK